MDVKNIDVDFLSKNYILSTFFKKNRSFLNKNRDDNDKKYL